MSFGKILKENGIEGIDEEVSSMKSQFFNLLENV